MPKRACAVVRRRVGLVVIYQRLPHGGQGDGGGSPFCPIPDRRVIRGRRSRVRAHPMWEAGTPLGGVPANSAYSDRKEMNVMTTVIVPESSCPNCGCVSETAAAVYVTDDAPTPGALSLCMSCAHYSKYDHHLQLTDLTTDELIQVAESSRLLRLQQSVMAVIERSESE